jgi:hypothetical protein
MAGEAGEGGDERRAEANAMVLQDLRERLAAYPAPLHRLGRMRAATPAMYEQLLAALLPVWVAALTTALDRAALEDLAVTRMATGRATPGQEAEDDPALGVLLEALRRDPDLMAQVAALDVGAVRQEQRLLLRALLRARRRRGQPRPSG